MRTPISGSTGRDGGLTYPLIQLTSTPFSPTLSPSDPINHKGNVMHLKTTSIRGFLVLGLLAGF